MNKPLICFHANCYDGFTAAWVADRALGSKGYFTVLHPCKYGDDPPYDLAKDRDVYVLDFSWPRDKLLSLKTASKSLLVLDHHKTAQAELEGLDFCVFDLDKAGCRMTWEHFHDTEPPEILLRIEDRDLWRWKYGDETKCVHAYVASLPMDLETWDKLFATPGKVVIEHGAVIRRYIDRYCEKVGLEARDVKWATPLGIHDVVVVNAPYMNASELADWLINATENVYDFTAAYFQRGDGWWQFSLRSRGDFDVSEVAKAYGGGGHKNAAGFHVESLPPEFLV